MTAIAALPTFAGSTRFDGGKDREVIRDRVFQPLRWTGTPLAVSTRRDRIRLRFRQRRDRLSIRHTPTSPPNE